MSERNRALFNLLRQSDLSNPEIERRAIALIHTIYTEQHNLTLLAKIKSFWRFIWNAIFPFGPEYAPSIDARDHLQQTALMLAAAKGSVPIIRKLLQCGADINARNALRNTALIWASHNNEASVVKFLIEARAHLNKQNIDGDTALHMAAHFGYVNIANHLIEAKASTLILNRNGAAPLGLAVQQSQLALILVLLAEIADVDEVVSVIPLLMKQHTMMTHAIFKALKQCAEESPGFTKREVDLVHARYHEFKKIFQSKISERARVLDASTQGSMPLVQGGLIAEYEDNFDCASSLS